MSHRVRIIIVLLVVSGLYWQFVCKWTGFSEPWDATGYWRLWYPVSVVLAAVGGHLLRKDGWMAGVIVVFAQLPILWINNGIGPLIAAGLLFLAVSAVPAMVISLLAGLIAARHRSKRA
jgi:hypothetical protein